MDLKRLRQRWPAGLLFAAVFALILISYAPASTPSRLPDLTEEQTRAVRLLRETVAQIEENYVSLPTSPRPSARVSRAFSGPSGKSAWKSSARTLAGLP